MRPLKRTILTTAGMLSFALLARGHAPPDQYATFGAQALFIDDVHTKLTWQRIVDQNLVSQAAAASKCANAGNGQRLPTYRELLTIVDEDPHDDWDPEAGATSPRYIDPDAFPATPAGPFWTMSPGADKNKPNNFKVVDFRNGTTRDEDFMAYYRCVSDDP